MDLKIRFYIGVILFFLQGKQGALLIQVNMITIQSQQLRHTPWGLGTPYRGRIGTETIWYLWDKAKANLASWKIFQSWDLSSSVAFRTLLTFAQSVSRICGILIHSFASLINTITSRQAVASTSSADVQCLMTLQAERRTLHSWSRITIPTLPLLVCETKAPSTFILAQPDGGACHLVSDCLHRSISLGMYCCVSGQAVYLYYPQLHCFWSEQQTPTDPAERPPKLGLDSYLSRTDYHSSGAMMHAKWAGETGAARRHSFCLELTATNPDRNALTPFHQERTQRDLRASRKAINSPGAGDDGILRDIC